MRLARHVRRNSPQRPFPQAFLFITRCAAIAGGQLCASAIWWWRRLVSSACKVWCWRWARLPPTGVTKFKDVEALLDAEPVLSTEQLGLAQWLARETRADLIECVNLMLPNGLAKRAGAIYELVPDQTLQMRSEALKQLVLMEVQEILPSSSTRQERLLSFDAQSAGRCIVGS